MNPGRELSFVDLWARRAGVTLAAGILVVVPEWTVVILREWENGFSSGMGYAWRAMVLAAVLPALWLVAELVIVLLPKRWTQTVWPTLRRICSTRIGHVLAYALWLGAVFGLAWVVSVSLWQDLDLPALIPSIDWEAQAHELFTTTPRMVGLGLGLGGLLGSWSAWRRVDQDALPGVIRHIGPVLLVMGLGLSLANIARPLGYFSGLHPLVMLLAFGLYLGGLTAMVPSRTSQSAVRWGRIGLPVLPAMATVGIILLVFGLGSPSDSTLRALDTNRPLASKLAVAALANPNPQAELSCPAPPTGIHTVAASEHHPRTAAEGELPDLLFVTVDALAAGRVGVLGNPRDATPNIDQLAREGALFTAAQSTGSATAVGVPAILFSRPFECLTSPAQDDLPSVFTNLKNAGYRTAAFYGYPMGEGVTTSYGKPLLLPFDRHEYRGDDPTFPNTSSPDDQVAAGAMDELIAAPSDRPLAIWVHFYNPHPVYNPPPSTRGKFGSGQSARYDEEVAATDAAFGRLWDQWREKRADKELVVVLTADHGQAIDELGEHGHAGSLVHSMVAVPLIIAGPGIKPTKLDRPVSTLDVGPTVLDILKVAAPESFLGQSLLPDIEGRGTDRPLRMTRSAAPNHLLQEAVVLGRYKLYREPRPKYAMLYRETEFFALYDLSTDPEERRNLADAFPDVVESMKPLLLSRIYATSDGDA